jgi:hypothetical protein
MIEVLDRLRTAADPDNLIDTFAHRVLSNRTSLPEPFQAKVSMIDLQSRPRVPASSAYRIIQEGMNTVLEFDGRRHVLPAQVRSALGSIVRRRSFRTIELPGALSADAKLGLSRCLYEIGSSTAAQ